MRADLISFAPDLANTKLLMCCCCGRFLPQEDFDLEHLIPKQALKKDPAEVRNNLAVPANTRSGNLLLCKRPLRYKQSPLYNNGCNSWKGRFYDSAITSLFHGNLLEFNGQISTQHLVGALVLAYLAMIARYGYKVALMQSGLRMREQFFSPNKHHPLIGTRSQMVLAGQSFTDPASSIWENPFSFKYDNGGCFVTVRNYVVIAPCSQDPEAPIVKHLKFVPHRFGFRPNFQTTLT